MKTEARSLPKLITACGLTISALLLTARWIRALEAPPAIASAATTRAAGTPRDYGTYDPTLTFSRLDIAEGIEYAGTGRDIFSSVAPAQTRKPHLTAEPPQTIPTRQESIAPFPMHFFGFRNAPNARKKVFLSQDGDIFVGCEGDIVNRRYKIVRIAPASVDVEDLFDNTRHTLALQG